MLSKRFSTPIQTSLDRVMEVSTIAVLNTRQACSSAEFVCVLVRLGKIQFYLLGKFGARGLRSRNRIQNPRSKLVSYFKIQDRQYPTTEQQIQDSKFTQSHGATEFLDSGFTGPHHKIAIQIHDVLDAMTYT